MRVIKAHVQLSCEYLNRFESEQVVLNYVEDTLSLETWVMCSFRRH